MGFLSRLRPSAAPLSTATSTWRIAACTVWERWDAFLVASQQDRSAAFAAYLAALDAESAAADELAAVGLAYAA